MIRASIATTLAATCLIATTAIAQTDFFANFDRDKNGRVTAGEISEQRDAEIIASMDTNKDGGVTRDEWQTTGRGASFVEKGGVDDRGVTRRWIEFNVVFYAFENETISTNWTEGQAPLAANATAADVAALRESLDERYQAPPSMPPRTISEQLAPLLALPKQPAAR